MRINCLYWGTKSEIAYNPSKNITRYPDTEINRFVFSFPVTRRHYRHFLQFFGPFTSIARIKYRLKQD